MLNIGIKEIIIIALILFLLFGAKKVPQLVRAIMSGIGEFNGLFRR